MAIDQEKVWASVSPEVLARVEAVRDTIEKATRIRPTLSRVVLMLLLRGLDEMAKNLGP